MNDGAVKKCHLLQLQNSRSDKTTFYVDLYSDCQKLNMKSFVVAKLHKGLMKIIFGGVEFLEIVKPVMKLFFN